jgi:eukaryotic-like serine/threonine-protein kinase
MMLSYCPPNPPVINSEIVAFTNDSIRPGVVIDGKYTIGRVIGSGGMGTVYEAVHNDSNQCVALKILHSKYAKSAKIVERFQQEARLAGSLEHNNICRVTDHGASSDGAPYLVMPLLSGRSLGTMLASGEPLSQNRIIDIICQTLEALEAAHAVRIVHRDLKPDNIFVTSSADRCDFVKLLDFGISKVLEKDSVSALTSTGMVLGTAYYLAPEQARGSKRIDHRVDIYAMGVILYEALTGVRPFEGDTYNEIVFNIAGEAVRTPRALNQKIPLGLEQVILKAMARDPGARFSSAKEMCTALKRVAVGDSPADINPLMSTMVDTDAEGTTAFVSTGKETQSRKRGAHFALLLGGIAVASGVGIYLLLHWNGEVSNTPPVRSDNAPTSEEAPPASPPSPAPPEARDTSARSVSDDSEKVSAISPNSVVDDTEATSPTDTSDSALKTKRKGATKESGRRRVEATGSRRQKRKKNGKSKQEKFMEGPFETRFIFKEE